MFREHLPALQMPLDPICTAVWLNALMLWLLTAGLSPVAAQSSVNIVQGEWAGTKLQ